MDERFLECGPVLVSRFSLPGVGAPPRGWDWADLRFLGTHKGDISPPVRAGSILQVKPPLETRREQNVDIFKYTYINIHV